MSSVIETLSPSCTPDQGLEDALGQDGVHIGFWFLWIAMVMVIRWQMVEQKLDGARSGLIGCLAGAKATLGPNFGDDLQWSSRYEKLRRAEPSQPLPSTNPPQPRWYQKIFRFRKSKGHNTTNVSEPSSRGSLELADMVAVNENQRAAGRSVTKESDTSSARITWDPLVVGQASVPAKEVRRHRSLASRWFVGELELHKMFWIGPPRTPTEVEIPPTDEPFNSLRTRIRTNRSRLESKGAALIGLHNEDQLTLVYGNEFKIVEEGTGRQDGRLDDFPANRTCKALRYGFNTLLFGTGIALRSWIAGLVVTGIVEVGLLLAWYCDRTMDNEHLQFCNRVAISANEIDFIARELLPDGPGEGQGGLRTIDVLLFYRTTAAWCRCAPSRLPTIVTDDDWDDNTWISLEIPTSRPIVNKIFNVIGLFSHTMLPWGWPSMIPNLTWATLALILESYKPFAGFIAIVFACGCTTFCYPQPMFYREDNWTIAWYAVLFQWLNGHRLDLQPVIDYFSSMLSK